MGNVSLSSNVIAGHISNDFLSADEKQNHEHTNLVLLVKTPALLTNALALGPFPWCALDKMTSFPVSEPPWVKQPPAYG